MLKRNWFYLIGCLILMSFSHHHHPYYISLIEVQHNPKEQTAECSIRIFTDDFESNLSTLHPNKKIDIQSVANKTLNNKLITEYINKKLQISINKIPKKLEFVGYEIQEESIWIYLETSQTTPIKQLDAFCTIMYDYNNKQINIFRVKANGTEKNTKLDYPKNTINLNW